MEVKSTPDIGFISSEHMQLKVKNFNGPVKITKVTTSIMIYKLKHVLYSVTPLPFNIQKFMLIFAWKCSLSLKKYIHLRSVKILLLKRHLQQTNIRVQGCKIDKTAYVIQKYQCVCLCVINTAVKTLKTNNI